MLHFRWSFSECGVAESVLTRIFISDLYYDRRKN